MREYQKRGVVLLLSLALCLSLAACGGGGETKGFTTHDAEVYVDGLIKENYLGEADPDYLELVGIHQADVDALYESVLGMDAEYFFYMYNIEYPTEELYQEVQGLYRQIYRYTKYEIVSAAQQEDGSFSVKVRVYPIDIAQIVSEMMADATKDFYEKYPVDELNAMGDSEYEKVDGEWARLMVDLYKDALAETGNMTEKTIDVQIEENSDGIYAMNSDDFARLDALIIDYTNMAEIE